MRYLLNRNTLQVVMGTLLLGAGLFMSSLVMVAAGGVILVLGILDFWPNLPLKSEHVYIIFLMTIGVVNLIDGFQTSDETGTASGVGFMLAAIALNIPFIFREEDLLYVTIIKVMITMIVGYVLGIGLYNFVFNYML